MQILNLEQHITDLLLAHFSAPNDIVEFKDEKGDGRHFFLRIVSSKFAGQSRLSRSRMVHALIDKYFGTGQIHALRMDLKEGD